MSITRRSWTDDSGNGTSGTILDNAELQRVYDDVDARWSTLTVTSTGTVNNLSITSGGVEADYIQCDNASDLTITGIVAPASPAKPGKRLTIIAAGAGNVYLAHVSGSSTAANRLYNVASALSTPLRGGSGIAGGSATYVYNGSAWLLAEHRQGAPVTYASTLAATSGTFTSATATFTYTLQGRSIRVDATIAITTIGTAAGAFTLTLPAASIAGQYSAGPGINASAPVALLAYIPPSSSTLTLYRYDGTVPTASNHTLGLSIHYTVA